MSKNRTQRLARDLSRNSGVPYSKVLQLLRQCDGALADLPNELFETTDQDRVIAILNEQVGS